MILGIGNDLADVRRFEAALKRSGERLAQRILAAEELNGFQASHRPSVYLAKRFAVKEAVAKALGTGFREGVSWREIILRNTELGQPFVVLEGHAHQRMASLGGRALHVSLSDEQHLISAFAVLEG